MNGLSFDDMQFYVMLARADNKYAAAIASSGQTFQDDERSMRPQPLFRGTRAVRELERNDFELWG